MQLDFGFNCVLDAAGATYTFSDIDDIPDEVISTIKANVNAIAYTDDNFPVYIQQDDAGVITIRDMGAYIQQLNGGFLSGTVKNLYYTLDEVNHKLVANSSYIGIPLLINMTVSYFDIIDSAPSNLKGTCIIPFVALRPYFNSEKGIYTIDDFSAQLSTVILADAESLGKYGEYKHNLTFPLSSGSTLAYNGEKITSVKFPSAWSSESGNVMSFILGSGEIVECELKSGLDMSTTLLTW